MLVRYLLLVTIILSVSCNFETDNKDNLFVKLDSSKTGVKFENILEYNNDINVYTYRNFYAGGGVALGDVNNDGLTDIYLTSNQGSNRLYINNGNFKFSDVTTEAGVGGDKPWSTGASIVDINGDGLLDIYVTNSGKYGAEKRGNELFLNKGSLKFKEVSESYNISGEGNSIHSSFFDYDRDGDLDLYIVNNYASKPIEEYNINSLERNEKRTRGGDKLYENVGEKFVVVNEEAGIYKSGTGFGLGVSASDVNRDGWVDMYVSNDFFEDDYLYINKGDGSFNELSSEKLDVTSSTSMGGDVADVNGDGFPEIFTTDMLPRREDRLKTVSDFAEWERLKELRNMGYNKSFARNMLHVNNRDGSFSEAGRYSGVEDTDWSWGALIADLDLDGKKDIYVPNGFYKDVTDKDHILNVSTKKGLSSFTEGGRVDFEKMVESTPSTPLPNYAFKNTGNMSFREVSSDWGLDRPSFSSGAAYGDLDDDGDLDLVVNNVNEGSSIYRNMASERHPERKWLQIALRGNGDNTLAVGAQVSLFAGEKQWYVEQMPQRGFQSSVDPVLHIGLGTGISVIDSLRVFWPNGCLSRRARVQVSQRIVLSEPDACGNSNRLEAPPQYAPPKATAEKSGRGIVKEVTHSMGFDWKHRESYYNDFSRSPLLFHMRSTEGPPVCIADVNNDGLDDFYVGGARGQSGALFLQSRSGRFQETTQPALKADRRSEDTACEFLDATVDGTPELYVGSGSSEFVSGSSALADRLYESSEAGRLTPLEGSLPSRKGKTTPTGAVQSADLEGDGDIDLFVGTRMALPSQDTARGYGMPVGGRIFLNNGNGRFKDATSKIAPGLTPRRLRSAGITDAVWQDLTGNGSPDLVVAGEWMPLTIFLNQRGQLDRARGDSVGLDSTHGWWRNLALVDLNGDGAKDLIGGNHGLNSRFEATKERPVHLWVGDLNRNGSVEHIFGNYSEGKGPYPMALRQDIIRELPYLRARYPSFSDYAGTTVGEMFTQKQLERTIHHQVYQLASVVGWNRGDGTFRIDSLPFRAQLAPMYGLLGEDLNCDGAPEILMGGNMEAVDPQVGSYEATDGVLLRQDSTGTYQNISSRKSGFESPGEIRSIQLLDGKASARILVGRNDDSLQVFRPTSSSLTEATECEASEP